MRKLPFSFHPVLIFSNFKDTLPRSFRSNSSNFAVTIVVDHGGYFGGARDMLMCGKSTPTTSTTDEYNLNAEDC